MSHRPIALALVLLASVTACGDVTRPTAPEALGITSPEAANLDRARTAKGPIVIEYAVAINVVDRYEFRAYRDENGKVSGRFKLRQLRYDPNDPRGSRVTLKARGRVVCIEAVGNKARLGGIVKKSNFKSILPVGSPLIWSVTDNGADGWSMNDTASQLLGGVDPYAYCKFGMAYPELPVTRGDLDVEDDDIEDDEDSDSDDR